MRNIGFVCRSLGTMLAVTALLGSALASCFNLTGDGAVLLDREGGADAQAPFDGTIEAAAIDSKSDDATSLQGDAIDSASMTNADGPGDAVSEETTPADAVSEETAPADAAADREVTAADVTDVSVPADRSEDADAFTDRELEEGAGPQSDFYVDPNAPDASTVFRTITAALAAANVSAAPSRTIHVAPGTYSAGSGESFPIVVRGVSLIGSGPSTVIVGLGSFNGVGGPLYLAGNDLVPISSSPVTASLVLGDKTGATRIVRVRIQSPSTDPPGSEGIICERGSTAGAGVTTPNTWIDDVTVDGFEVALRLTFSLAPSPQGCAAAVTSSTFTNGYYGIFADGWASADGTLLQRVSAQIGDATPTGGNAFAGFSIPASGGRIQFDGAGLLTREAVTGLIVRSNRFSRSDIGIFAAQAFGSMADRFDIEQNDLGPLTNTGIIFQGPVAVDPLAANTIHDITTAGTGLCFPGIGLLLQSAGAAGFPSARARGNTIFGNDSGLQIRTYSASALNTLPDFGTATDPGGNTFRCNSWAPTCCTNCDSGGDVVVETPGKTPTVPFEGNVWDHAPPLVSPQGDDVVLYSGPSVDFANASAATAPACPAAHVP